MKMSRVSLMVFGSALLLSSSALAGEPNKGTLVLHEKVTIEGQAVEPGRYTVEWDGDGPSVQVKVLRGKQTVATFPAHLAEQPLKSTADAYGSDARPDGTKSLTAVYLNGKKTYLQVEQKEAGQPSTSSASK